VTEDVARQVQARLTAENSTQLARPQPVKPEALEAYLQGNYHLNGFGKGSGDEEAKKAGEYFQHAIDVDPNFAPAYLGLANSHGNLLWPSSQDAAILEKATGRALELDPNSADALVMLGGIKMSRDWDFREAEEEYRRALALSPNNANVHTDLCVFLYQMGRKDEAARECQISQELDPAGDPRRDVDALNWAGKEDAAISLAQMLYEQINLGPYQEEIRKYLKGGGTFPTHVGVMVILSALERPVLAMSLPSSYRNDSQHRHRFHIPGMTFVASVGGREEDPLSVLLPPHPILITTEGDKRVQQRCWRYKEEFRRVGLKRRSWRELRKSKFSSATTASS
jgi:Tetratricopeptide repeat